MARFLLRANLRRYVTSWIRMAPDQLGELGKGAGKGGGGGGGSVRETGGAFGKRETAEEERYFKQKEKEQM
uniref:ATPase inhibitor, mitochondrial n=1 Tax=Amphilophus citrinellus TaxID=61819 RepID=A0A3Q0R9A2_AMPCI